METFLQNLFSFSMQLAIVIGGGLLMSRLLSRSAPGVRLVYFHGLLAVALAAPFLPLRLGRSGSVATASGEVLTEGVLALGTTPVAWPVVSGVALFILIVGVLVRLVRAAAGFGHLAKLRKRVTRFHPPLDLWELVGSSTMARARCYQSSAISVPLTYGLLSPVVLLPDSFFELSLEQQRAVVCHELLHVKRGDWCVSLIEELLRTALWFHPAIHALLSKVSACREQVVDREVLRLTRSRRAYLEAILLIARSARPMPRVLTAALIRKSELRERISAMQKEGSMPGKRLVCSASLIVLLVAASVVVGAATFPVELGSESPVALGSIQEEAEETEEAPPFFVAGDVTRPVKISGEAPRYSEIAREARIEGVVILELIIGKQGSVESIEVLKGLPMELTDRAIEAVETWRYQPATLKGEPVRVLFNVTINFQLKKDCEEDDDCEP